MPTAPKSNRLAVLAAAKEQKHHSDVVVPLAQCGGGPLRIRCTHHPDDTFYKDEGGKSNHMVAQCVVESVSSPKSTQHFGAKLLVVPHLCYENGNEVEDADEIFKVISVEPKTVASSEQRITVKFRIDKVSRRKDGQRFKLRLEADDAFPREVKPAFTSAVCVLSKRKFPANRGAGTGHKRLKGGVSRAGGKGSSVCGSRRVMAAHNGGALIAIKSENLSTEVQQAVLRSTAQLETKVADLVDQVTLLSKRVIALEAENMHLRHKRLRMDSLDEEDDENFNAAGNNDGGHAGHASGVFHEGSSHTSNPAAEQARYYDYKLLSDATLTLGDDLNIKPGVEMDTLFDEVYGPVA